MQEDMRKKEKHLEAAVPRDINRGLVTVKRICNDHRIPGVHGPLIELFDCDEKFNTAVEVTAGNNLFHIVVDSDEIATKIIHYLNQEKGARLSIPHPLPHKSKPSSKLYSYNPRWSSKTVSTV
eukprot:1180743-Prorocentrum_minimum.AAC.4